MKLSSAFCGLALAACLAAAPAAAESGAADSGIVEFDLPNGLHVIFKEDHTLPLIAADVMYKAGSADEIPGRTGFAHLFEHLMFCGSAHVGKGQFPALVHSVYGSYNASTHEDYTNYYITVPSNNLPMALFLESDRMGYFIDDLRPGIVDEQRDVVKNEVREQHNKTFEETLPVLFPGGHPYGHRAIGVLEDLDAVRYEDVVRFYKRYYVPGNASLAIVGDFDAAEAKKLVEYWFSDVPKGQFSSNRRSAAPQEFSGAVKKTIYNTDTKPSRWLYWHTPALAQDGDDALNMLSSLFYLENARIRQRVLRDKPMVSDIWFKQESLELGSFFTIVFFPLPGYAMDDVQKIVDEEIERISAEPPSQQEMDMALTALECEYGLNYGCLANYAEEMNRSYLFRGKAVSPADVLERFRRLTPEDISACAKRYLRPDKRLEITVLPESASADKNNVQKTGEGKP